MLPATSDRLSRSYRLMLIIFIILARDKIRNTFKIVLKIGLLVFLFILVDWEMD